MLFTRLLGMISGYVLTLSCVQTHPLVTHRRRGVPGIGGAIDLGKAGAAAAKSGKAGEGVKGGGELGKITATPAGPSTAKPGGFAAAPKPAGHSSSPPKRYEPGGPSHSPPVTPTRKPEIVPASPDPSVPSRPLSPTKFPLKLIDYFADTKNKFFRMIASRLALERQVDTSLEEYMSRSEAYLQGSSKGKTSTDAPEFANGASGKTFWSKMMNIIRPQSKGEAAPTRIWKWLQSLWQKIPETQGAQSFVPNRRLNAILRILGEDLTKDPNSRGFVTADTWVKEFLQEWRATLSQAELKDPKVIEDMKQTGKNLETLLLRLQENTEAKKYLISASEELQKWKTEHLDELAEAVVTTRSNRAPETIESTKEELKKLNPEDLTKEFQPRIEEATDAFTTEEKKTIFGELSKDPSNLKRFRPQLDEALNLETLMEQEVKTANTKTVINDFAEARAGQRSNSEASEAAHRAAPAGLTIADLLEALPEVELARKFYIFKLIKAFEKLLDPLKKSTKEVLKHEIKRGFKVAYDTPGDLKNIQRQATKFISSFGDDKPALDTLFKKLYNTELTPKQILAKLKDQDVSIESGTRKSRELLDQLKGQGLLNEAQHEGLTSSLEKDHEHYKSVLDSFNLETLFLKKMHEKIYAKLTAPLDSPQKEKLLDEVADQIVPRLLETLDLDSKNIYLNPNNYREGKSAFQEVTELYTEENLETRVFKEVLKTEKDVEEFKKAHFSQVVAPPPVKPIQSTGPNAGFGANRIALESEFLDALKIPHDKYKSYELLKSVPVDDRSRPPAFGRSPGDPVETEKLDGRYMALYEDPLKVGDDRLKGTRFENLSDTAINQLNAMAKRFGESVTELSQKYKTELESRAAIQRLIQTLRPHHQLISEILAPKVLR